MLMQAESKGLAHIRAIRRPHQVRRLALLDWRTAVRGFFAEAILRDMGGGTKLPWTG
ncbi:MAG: hypothetical protein AB7I42_03055 [Bradyrhizobium sp.]|uniref:hypothetical protein n=1 Tax=Bradyrhizobium sp. TaxID=376 RepID=UPI002A2C5F96|nr:hypothetical protein [Bradyrhizobium sp.]